MLVLESHTNDWWLGIDLGASFRGGNPSTYLFFCVCVFFNAPPLTQRQNSRYRHWLGIFPRFLILAGCYIPRRPPACPGGETGRLVCHQSPERVGTHPDWRPPAGFCPGEDQRCYVRKTGEDGELERLWVCLPDQQRWQAKVEARSERVRVAYTFFFFFATFGRRSACSVGALAMKFLRRSSGGSFMKCALLVGWSGSP